MSTSEYIARLALMAFILSANGFFAAAEISLLSVRDSRLRHMAAEGHSGARAALLLLSRPERLLSVTQICVTLASLGLGWAGEDTLFSLLMELFHPALTPATKSILQAFCFALAFAAMTWAHVVLGEVLPKNLAIEKADRLAVVVAPVLVVVSRLASPFVTIVEYSAAAINRMFGMQDRPGSGHAGHLGGGHSAEELRLIVTSSRFSGHIPERLEGIIHRVLDLSDLSAREIMTPRREIVSVPANARLDEVLDTMVASRHSRLPVWKGAPEHIVGIVFFKDLLRHWHERRAARRQGRQPAPFVLQKLTHPPLIVPQTKPVSEMLEEFRLGHTHMALVVDEFGTVTGLVTVEDVLEQIVGEIEDEYDDPIAAINPNGSEIEIPGATTIRDFEFNFDLELPSNAGFETLAGYLLYRLGHIPKVGESVDFEGHRLTVTAMERNRIASVKMSRDQAGTKTDDAGN